MIGAGALALASHWRRHWGQFLTLVAGLALATALWAGVQAINAEARASYARAAGQVDAAALDQIVRDGGVTMADFATLRRGGWLVTPVVEGKVTLAGRQVRLLGVDPLTAPDALKPGAMALTAQAGRGPPPLFAAPDQAAALDAAPSDGVPEGMVVTDISRAFDMLGSRHLSRLSLLPRQPLRQTPLADLGPYRQRAAAPAPDLGRLTASFHLNLTAFGLLAFAVGLFVVNGTIGLAFEQRRATIRTLRALGLPLRALAGLLAVELTVLALLGGALGVVLGGLIAAALLPDVAASLSGLYGAEVPSGLTLRASWWLSGLAMAVGGTALAGAAALIRLARMPLLAPARPRAWALAGRRAMRGAAVAGLLLLIAAAGLLALGDSLATGFAGLGALLLGAAAILPFVLTLAVALGTGMARGTVARWVWADTGQQLPGLGLALMALMLALAANIGVATMVGSFRATFTGWLDQRLAAELYVSADDTAQAGRMRAVLPPGVRALPIWGAETRAAGQPVSIRGFVDDPTYRRNWPLLAEVPAVWDRAAAGDGVLINEQLARSAHLAPGDALALPDWRTRVLGVYSDYGNPQGQVLAAAPLMTAHYPDVPRLRFALRVGPRQMAATRTALAATGLDVTDQAAQKRAAMAVFDRTFVVTGSLNVLTLGVAGFAMLTALLTLAAMRLPQLAPVWAMGLTRRRLATIEVARALGLAALTFVAAVPVGLALAWVLLAVINVQAFGWRLPMRLFPAEMARLLALALAAAGLAAAWPAWRLARRPVGDLLRVFAGER